MTATADLVITNGDAASELLRRTLQGAEVLPWHDVLYEGPVPLTETLEDLTAIRAEYLAGAGGGDLGAIQFELSARDRGISMSQGFARVVLWFEHDLYDQLQLIQILDWFAANPRADGSLFLIQAQDYIGRQTPEAIEALVGTEKAASQEQIQLAKQSWAAFRQPTPVAWARLRDDDLAALPFLRPAVVRMLEELPGPDGLTRTERQMLATIQAGQITPLALFVTVQKQEEAVFMGDWSFWRLLDGLAMADAPLIAGLDAAPFQHDVPELAKPYLTSLLSLTPLGEEVLAGGADWLVYNDIDLWWGGTHLTNDALWRFDAGEKELIPATQ
ncbi:MAG TPA: hypothetical protein VNO69_10900 [Methyloceanibacter sp.]|nr:hypothetical protein [Methyloceanibacter sp.]